MRADGQRPRARGQWARYQAGRTGFEAEGEALVVGVAMACAAIPAQGIVERRRQQIANAARLRALSEIGRPARREWLAHALGEFGSLAVDGRFRKLDRLCPAQVLGLVPNVETHLATLGWKLKRKAAMRPVIGGRQRLAHAEQLHGWVTAFTAWTNA